jgi:hypothetical protein
MRKLIAGLLVALVVGAGGYFGAVYWAERTAAREVDGRLERWRSGGGTVTRGRIAFDLWTRTLKVADVAIRSPSSPDEWIAIEEVIATGIDMSGGARRLVLVGLEISHALPGPAGILLQQKAPRVTFTDFSERPMARAPIARANGTPALDSMRRWLELLGAIAASFVEAPSLAVTIAPATRSNRPDRTGDPMATAEYTYSNVFLRDLANGRIAEASVDKVALRSAAAPTSRGFTGEMANASVRDVDMGPVLAWLDPSLPREEGYRRVYGRLAAGPYTVRFDDGAGMSIDQILAEEIGLQPTKLSLDDLVFLMEVTRPGVAPPTTGQLSMLVEKMAGLYEGLHLGRLEIQGLRVNAQPESIAIGSIALNGLQGGRLGELAIEGLEGQKAAQEAAKETAGIGGMIGLEGLNGRTAPRDGVHIGRLNLKGLDIANLLRTASTQLASQGQRPDEPSPLMAMLGLIEGIEIRDFAAPYPATARTVHVEAFDASWGQLVGGIPSEGRLSARVSGPIGASDPDAFIKALAERGIATLVLSLELGARWQEAEQRVVMAPATVEIRDVLAMSIRASAGNVRREMLSTDILKALAAAPLVEAGPVELTLRDLGLVELAAAQLGQANGGDAQAGRALLVETMAQRAAAAAQTSPELQPILDALTQFVRGKGETLTIALTPKGSVGLLQLVEAARGDAVGALLANFTVEVRTGG